MSVTGNEKKQNHIPQKKLIYWLTFTLNLNKQVGKQPSVSLMQNFPKT